MKPSAFEGLFVLVRPRAPLISDRHPLDIGDDEETARAYAAGEFDTGASVGCEERETNGSP